MPLFDYRIDGTGELVEQLFLSGETIPDVIESSQGRIARRIVVPLIARVNWDGDVRQRSYYNRGLGCVVEGDAHARQIARSRGLVPWVDLGDDTDQTNLLERAQSKQAAISQAETAELAEFDANLIRCGGDRALAVAETWSAQRILAGDTVFAE